MGLPRTAVGIFGFMIFVGWMIALLFSNTPDESGMRSIINTATASQDDIGTAADGLSGTSGLYESITAVFSIFFNLFVIAVSFIAILILTPIEFTARVLAEVPFVISGTFMALLLVGLVFALLSKLIEVRE